MPRLEGPQGCSRSTPFTPRSIQDCTARSSGTRFAVLEFDDEAFPVGSVGVPGTRWGRSSEWQRLEVECSSSRESLLRQPEGPSNQEIGFEAGDGDTESLQGHSDLRESLTFQFPQPNPRWPIKLRWAPESGKPSGVWTKWTTLISSECGVVMKSPPKFVRGACFAAMRIALQEIVEGSEARNVDRQCRGWKLFLLLPRMLQECSCSARHEVDSSRSTDFWSRLQCLPWASGCNC